MQWIKYWVLDKGGEPKQAKNLHEWGRFLNTDLSRVVKQEMVGRVRVSTIFLSLDHNWGDGPPILWETMVFGGKFHEFQKRCSGGREQAEAMHAETVAMVRSSRKKKNPATGRSR